MPKITVIVPIYNSSKYLRRCVDSLLRQSFTDWECLLIDDGSTDDSFEVCEDIVRTDKRLKLFHIPNSGVSVARNIGLEMVAGEWISFVDSDDWLEHDTYEYAISQAEEHKADIIQWQFHYEPYISEPKGFIKTPQELKLKKSVALAFWKNACWGQLVKTELVKKNKIKFPEHITVGEDRFFCYCCYSCATRIWQLPNTFYHYYQSEDSLMNKNFSIKKIEDDAKSLAMTETYMLEKRESRFEKSILISKMRIKSMCFSKLDPPNLRKWRTLFPEINIKLLFVPLKSVIFNWLIVCHLDYIACKLISIKYGRKCR